MKICPKCRRSYADSVDFCLRDGKPLVNSAEEAEALRPLDGEGEGVASAGRSGESDPASRSAQPSRPRALFQTGVLQSVQPPVPVASTRREPPPAPPAGGPSSFANAVGNPPASSSTAPGAPPPPIKPWIPGQSGPTLGTGIRLTMAPGGSAQVPPWEVAANAARPLPTPPPVAPPPTPPPSEPEVERIVTPDLPLPPEVREEAVPVGDETVIVVPAQETPELVEELELEAVPTTPPEPEIPLHARVTRRAALPRPSLTIRDMPPPVEEEADSGEQRVAILTEEDTEPPVPGEDGDFQNDFILVAPARRGGAAAATASASADAENHLEDQPRRPSPMLLGMYSVLALAAGVLLFLYFSSGGESTSGEAGDPDKPAVQANDPGAGGSGGSSGNPAESGEGDGGATTGTALANEKNPSPPVASPAPVMISAPEGTSGAQPAVQPPPAAPSMPAPAVPPRQDNPATAPERPTVTDPGAGPARAATPEPARGGSSEVARPTASDPQGTAISPAAQTTARARPTSKREEVPAAAGSPAPTRPAPVAKQETPSLEPAAVPAAAASVAYLINANEVGAEVFVNDSPAGKTPITVKLPPGNHTVRVVPRGKPEQQQLKTVTVSSDAAPGKPGRLNFTF